jgi:nitroreductase
LDLSRPVDREAVAECVARASYAPNRSDHQSWRWLVVDDPALRAEIGEDYRRMTVPAVTSLRDAKLAEGDNAGVRISESVLYLAVKMGQVLVDEHISPADVRAVNDEMTAFEGHRTA